MTPASRTIDLFVILLPVFNGARFLEEQLNSIAAQTDPNWRLIASDDGSTDASLSILEGFATRFPDKVRLTEGPQKGLVANVSALYEASVAETGPVVLCDQDDIWLSDRLASDRAVLSTFDSARPVLLCRRTQLCDETGSPLGLSPNRTRPPSFANALVQNIASGNTMVLTPALMDHIRGHASKASDCVYHDWWIYQIATGIGAHVHHDQQHKILYRRHDANLVGVPFGLTGLFLRIRRIFARSNADAIGRHLDALDQVREHLTPSARRQLDAYRTGRTEGPIGQIRGLWSAGVYRQSRFETLVLMANALMGRL